MHNKPKLLNEANVQIVPSEDCLRASASASISKADARVPQEGACISAHALNLEVVVACKNIRHPANRGKFK